MADPERTETELYIGPSAIAAYSRLSYSMWYALAEFIDNSTQSRLNYDGIIADVLKEEGNPLTVDILHDKLRRTISIEDNSIGMTQEKLVAALRIAHPTPDSKGRSKYGMGLKTAASWIGAHWKVITTEWGSGIEWTADVDVAAVARGQAKIPLTPRKLGDTNGHYTKIVISSLHRNIQQRTEEMIRSYLSSMYQFDLAEGLLKITYNGVAIEAAPDHVFDTDPRGIPMKRDLPALTLGTRTVRGWIGVLRKGGRKYGGFSLFQNRRQIQGIPHAWKPRCVYGGEDDEGANNLVSQRLVGVLHLDGFEVSHTKDAILYQGDEEEQLEEFLEAQTKDYREYSIKRRGARGGPWSKEKVRDILEAAKREFTSGEMRDALDHTVLPPLETILQNNKTQVAALSPAEKLVSMELSPDLKVVVSLQERSEYDPHLTIEAAAEAGTIHVVLNGLHPYYRSLEPSDALDECFRQYIFDAIAEYKVSKLTAKVNPDSVRRLKDALLRVPTLRLENVAESVREGSIEANVGLTKPKPTE